MNGLHEKTIENTHNIKQESNPKNSFSLHVWISEPTDQYFSLWRWRHCWYLINKLNHIQLKHQAEEGTTGLLYDLWFLRWKSRHTSCSMSTSSTISELLCQNSIPRRPMINPWNFINLLPDIATPKCCGLDPNTVHSYVCFFLIFRDGDVDFFSPVKEIFSTSHGLPMVKTLNLQKNFNSCWRGFVWSTVW